MANRSKNSSDSSWRHFHKLNFNKKQAAKRLRRVETKTLRHAHKFLLRRWQNVCEVRQIVFLWLIGVAALILAAGLQLSWDQSSYTIEAAANNGTYEEAVIGPIETLNPLFADTPATLALSKLMFSSLLYYDKTGHLNYDLAHKVSLSDDGKKYRVELRSDVRWHDGMPLTADDVVFTVGAIKDPDCPTKVRGWEDITVKKVDDYTVEFSLARPYAPFKNALNFAIIPQHMFKDVPYSQMSEATFDLNPIGSGAFSFKMLQDSDSGNKNDRIVHLVANQNYYRGQPSLAKLRIHTYANSSSIERALKLGEVNAASGISPLITDNISSERYDVIKRPIQSGVYAFLNTSSDILSDKAVRQALQRATNTAEIRQKLGDLPALNSPYTDFHLSDETLVAPEYDLALAQKILESAGWKLDGEVRKKGDKVLELSLVSVKNTQYEKVMESLIGQWRKLGVKVNERVIDASDPVQDFVQTTLQPRAYDVLLYEISLGGDPDVFAYWHSSQTNSKGLNFSNYRNSLADDILTSARSTSLPKLREAKHATFAKQWIDDVPAIGIYQSVDVLAVTKNAGGLLDEMNLVSPEQRYNEAKNWSIGTAKVYKTP